MRKTLLIAAATLAAGVIAAQADSPVYSQNIVGYYNVPVPATKFTLLSVQLSDANATFQINSQLTNGVADGSSLYIWNGGSFDTYSYYAGYGWYDVNFNLSTSSIPAGASALIYNGSTSPMTNTIIGVVPTNSVIKVPRGSGFYALGTPISTNIDSTLAGFPCQDGDNYYQWDTASQAYTATYIYYAGYGWYDQNFNIVYPTPSVGSGFYYFNNGIATNWNFSFTIPQ